MTSIIYPYKMGSKSARLLSSALSTVRVRPHGKFRNNFNRLIVNWGNSVTPHFPLTRCLNLPQNVEVAANKLTTFRNLGETQKPMYTTIKGEALFWIENGKKVVCRTLLTGHSGNGIVIASTAEEVVEAPLYTEFINKDKEFRVHVFNGTIIDFQQKKKRNGVEANGDIRNHGNGWVYARSDVTLPPLVAEQSIKAVSSLRLDFGAVDICTSLEGGVFVFEVNTAPGLEGTTLAKYVEAIKKYEESFNGR